MFSMSPKTIYGSRFKIVCLTSGLQDHNDGPFKKVTLHILCIFIALNHFISECVPYAFIFIVDLIVLQQ